ncbi:MAG: aspartyl-tRNA(Asn)/glutamyl-tRNA(Gln) amidotransferase subunit A [Loktanella salsilacus]|jgi:aspartyl-tRNA(Asn)/glutamyl-tRNA(Gln) amidotransferase subunit A|uniref:amidase n=1 Tax=Loktanella salsilacus TaxID=195913 RepID=UPI003988C111
MDDWRWMTATALGQGIADGSIDPVALTEVFLTAIDTHEHRDRIYARVTADRARAEALAASHRAKAGLRRSPLDGVPVSWKDLFDTAGVATEAGTRLMAGRIPDTDAEVLRNATAAGLVCLGKTHLSEIAFSGLGLNPMTATSPNVNDPDVVPGGSSSGAAASVAFGLAAAGIGSDTGGSVRIPSAWNDITGFKTTHGRLSLAGSVPLCGTFDTVGPLCRSVGDAALLTAAMAGTKAPDLRGTDGPLRLAILDTITMDDVREQPLAGFTDAASRLRDAGADITHIALPDLAQAFAASAALYTADSWAWWRDRIEANPTAMFPQIYARISAGRDIGAADYIAAWSMLRDLRKAYAAATASFDAVIMPTAAIMPPNVDRLLTDDDYYKSENLLALRNTRVANLMDLPAVSLPTGTPSCGIMLCGHTGQDDRLLRVAAQAEAALQR